MITAPLNCCVISAICLLSVATKIRSIYFTGAVMREVCSMRGCFLSRSVIGMSGCPGNLVDLYRAGTMIRIVIL